MSGRDQKCGSCVCKCWQRSNTNIQVIKIRPGIWTKLLNLNIAKGDKHRQHICACQTYVGNLIIYIWGEKTKKNLSLTTSFVVGRLPR